MNKKLYRTLIIVFVICCNIGCDQVSKKLIRDNVAQNEIIPVIGKTMVVTHVENTGAFLSLGDSLSNTNRNIFLSIIPMILLLLGFGYILRKEHFSKLSLLAFCCILGGGIGNIFDRVVHGSVTDFLHIDFGLFQTGIFNMADLSITTGAIILLIQAIKQKQQNTKSELPQ